MSVLFRFDDRIPVGDDSIVVRIIFLKPRVVHLRITAPKGTLVEPQDREMIVLDCGNGDGVDLIVEMRKCQAINIGPCAQLNAAWITADGAEFHIAGMKHSIAG